MKVSDAKEHCVHHTLFTKRCYPLESLSRLQLPANTPESARKSHIATAAPALLLGALPLTRAKARWATLLSRLRRSISLPAGVVLVLIVSLALSF